MKKILAYIVPIDPDAHPEHPIVRPPEGGTGDGIWGPTDPFPTNPIVIPPDAIAPGVPTHPIYLPVYPAHPIVIPPNAIGPGVPTHPIVLPPYRPEHPIIIPPDSVSPGVPAHPIVLPGVPTHPIVLPPGIWPEPPEGQAPHPEHPIVIPPPVPDAPSLEVYTVWTEEEGWMLLINPQRPHPTPSGGTGGRRG
jgi:hypothetical protein